MLASKQDMGSDQIRVLVLFGVQAVHAPRLIILTRRFFSSLPRGKTDDLIVGHSIMFLASKYVASFGWDANFSLGDRLQIS